MKKHRHDSNIRIFIRAYRASDRRHQRMFPVLVFFMAGVGLFESLTMAWVAGFASGLADPTALTEGEIFQRIARFLPFLNGITEKQFIIGGSLLLSGLVLIKNTLRAISQYISTRFATAVRSKIGQRMMTQVLYRPYVWFLDRKSADLQQLIDWSNNVGWFLQDILVTLTNIIVIVFMLATLFLYDPAVTIPVMAVISILSVLLFKMLRRSIDRQSHREKEIMSGTFRSATYTIRAYKDVRIENVEQTFLMRFRDQLRRLIKVASLRALLNAIPALLLEFVGFLALSGMIIILVQKQGLDSGATLSYMAILAVVSWRVIPAVNVVLRAQTKIRNRVPFILAVFEFLEEDIKTEEIPDQGLEPLRFQNELKIENITFSYPTSDSPVLEELSLEIKRGEKVGIIGISGSGKTTLVDIIAGLLKPQAGNLSVDGTRLEGDDLKRWQKAIGYMPQSPFLVPGTLAENVAFGIPEEKQNLKRIKDSLIRASLEEDRWNADEMLSETGRNLSGGQGQRMALARMFYRNSDILLIDEGTSSLDQETEARILDDLFAESSDKTIILITHRRESLYRCRRIISIDKGTIVADGPPEQILKRHHG